MSASTKFPPPDVPYIRAKYQGDKQNPTLIVMHSTVSTASAGAAYAIAMMWNRNTSPQSSAHYVVDAAKTYQCVYDSVVAWHCGYNTGSIGVEMCDNPSEPSNRWEKKDHIAMFNRTVDLVAQLCLSKGIRARFLTDDQLRAWGRNKTLANGGITTHAQMSRVFKKSTHWDPGVWPSQKFLLAVTAKIKSKTEKANEVKRPVSQIKTVAWNRWNENPIQNVKDGIHEMRDELNPHVFVLDEATNLKGRLDHLGYQVVQLGKKPKKKGNISEGANVAILVRSDCVIKKRKKISLKSDWKGPKAGLMHDPRIHRVVKVKLPDGRTWKVLGTHGPFGARARSEFKSSLRKFFKNTKVGLPTIALMDANLSVKEMRESVGSKSGAKTSGVRIEVALYKHCKLAEERELKKYHSDHHPIYRVFES